MSAAIKCGALWVSLGVVEAVYRVLPIGQALAVLARGAWAPSSNRKLNRSILGAIEGQQRMAAGEFDPSAAVREINRSLQTYRRSRSALNWDEIARALCGLYTTLPVRSAYIDGELDLAKAIADKRKLALRKPCDLLTIAHADAILHKLIRFGTSIDLRSTQRALALERFSERPSAGTGGLREERGSLALMPRQGSAAPRTRFGLGLVNHVAGGGPPGSSGYDKRAPSGASGPGPPDDDGSCSGDCTDGGFTPCGVFTTKCHGKTPCWNPDCA